MTATNKESFITHLTDTFTLFKENVLNVGENKTIQQFVSNVFKKNKSFEQSAKKGTFQIDAHMFTKETQVSLLDNFY